MLKNSPYRIVPLSRIVLLKLYVEHVNDSPKDRFSAEDVCGLFRAPMSRNLVETALSRLSREGGYGAKLVSSVGTKKDGTRGFRIAEEGIFVVERGLRDPASDLSYFYNAENEVTALEDVAGLNGIFWTDSERVDADQWQPLDLSRSGEELADAVAATEQAIDLAESSNELGATFPAEREGLLASLKEGVRWLKEKRPSKATIDALLLNPLRWLAGVFANSAVGEAAKRAAQKLLDWIASALL
ncbi:hypothetical protein ACO2I3_13680 [Leptospira interrogans]